MFDPVDPKQSFPILERGIQRYWLEEGMFHRSLDQRRHAPVFSFYDGPPFATGLPHYGHLLAGTIKDVIPRYQTMRGKYVERRFGWDCHGLPIENLIEKEQGLTSKKQIEEMGVARFNALCRGAVQRCTDDWRRVVERMGRWVDMDWDYRTMDPPFMESMWWAFSKLFDKKLIYEGHKPMHVCPRCVTPLSNFEVTQGYKDVDDQTVTAMFAVEGETETYFLAWTTTPWTLPGNLFLAVGEKVEYVRVKSEGKTFILAAARVEAVFGKREYALEGDPILGHDLIGKTYRPLFPYFAQKLASKAFRVVPGEFVTTEDGTGIVHIATGFGDDDYAVGVREGVGVLQHVTMEGKFIAEVTDFAGMDVKPKDEPSRADKLIARWLKEHGLLFSSESYRHSYPHCWRCDSPLLNYATSSWFVKVEAIKEDMLRNAASTEWVPDHLRDGRFGKWLENARDWAISRNRYWGTPLPIWRNTDGSDLTVIGSRDELMQERLIRFTKLTVMRHSESEGNVVPVYQGVAPGTDLTTRGRSLAQETANALRTQDVTVIYCSPLARTQQTAQILAEATGAKIIVDERLREKGFGDYEGKPIPFTDLEFQKACRINQLARNIPEAAYHLPSMETWAQTEERVTDFLRDVLPQHRGDHVVVVTHADPLLHVRRFFTGEDLLKLSRQPTPDYAAPESFFYDHDEQRALDLHKETVDSVMWPGSPTPNSVQITLIRHGETDWNKDHLVQGGNVDRPLNSRGRAQAADAADLLKSERFDAIISSDLTRAVETAEIISKRLGIPYEERWQLLRERDLGEWVGKTIEEVMKENPAHHQGVNPAMHHRTPAGGESFAAFFQRAEDAYMRILNQFAGKRVLIVAHNGMMQAMRGIAENTPYRDIVGQQLKNCEALQMTISPMLSRIPEVLDCWFESGSMPYAQPHFPFKIRPTAPGSALPPNFPADFIAEGVDQTRTWFYTLMVLSTALFDQSPYRHVVVNGIVLAEDGKKMSKRLKNYPDPMDVVEKHGADALRFALMSSPAVRAEDLRFSERTVEEALRSVILPMWNAYSFFVTYANAAQFEPIQERRVSSHPLDRWILAEVRDLTNRMTRQLDAYDLSATCAELHETIDALTNWYIRLSRRRFAGKSAMDGNDKSVSKEEQHEALTTLHEVLITICQLLAPFCPFVTEAIYLNLVPTKHGSIHLTDWPRLVELDDAEQALLDKNRLLRLVVSLGNTVRAQQKVKIRQPLRSATVVLPPKLQPDVIGLTEEDIALLREEMNVIEVRFAEGSTAQAIIQVDARKVGPRLGKRVQEVIRAGKEGSLVIGDDGLIRYGDDIVLSPEEFSVLYQAEEGQGTAAERGVVVTLDLHIDEALGQLGLLRDVIRLVQRLRKESGLQIGDRIMLSVSGIDEVIAAHGAVLAHETSAVLGSPSGEAVAQTADLDGTSVTIRFSKHA